MIRHIVLLRIAPATSPVQLEAAFEALQALHSSVPGIVAIHHGSNASPEGLMRDYSHLAVIAFTSGSARDAYLIDPLHLAVSALLIACTEGGIEGVLVADLELA